MLNIVQTPAIARTQVPLDRTHLAAEWLLDSGICRPGFGVAEDYRTDGREYAPVSRKATAHYVSALLWLFEKRGETRYIDRALTAAQYLSRSSRDMSGLTLAGGMVRYDRSADRRFDEGSAIIRALVESWHASQHSEFLTKAIECGYAMQRIPGLCGLESARGWLELALATGKAQWRELYDQALTWSLSFYRVFFEPDKQDVRAASTTKVAGFPSATGLTNRCCFLEALLAHISQPGSRSDETVGIFEKLFEVTSNEIRTIARKTTSRNDVPTEAYARLLRLRLQAGGLGLIKLDAHQAEREARLIRDMQADHYDARIRGGYYTGRPSNVFARVVGLSTTAVSLQALEQWQQYQDSCLRPCLPQLV